MGNCIKNMESEVDMQVEKMKYGLVLNALGVEIEPRIIADIARDFYNDEFLQSIAEDIEESLNESGIEGRVAYIADEQVYCFDFTEYECGKCFDGKLIIIPVEAVLLHKYVYCESMTETLKTLMTMELVNHFVRGK